MTVKDNALALAEQVGLLEIALTKSNADVDWLNAEVIRLQAIIDAPPPTEPPPVVTPKTLLGISGRSVIDGAAQRWFDSGAGLSRVAPRRSKASCPVIHASWKALGAIVTDQLIIAAFANLLDGDKVELEHESDVKYRRDIKAGNPLASSNLAKRLALKSDFHDRVVRLRNAGSIAKVETVNTLSSYSWELEDQDRFICRADVIGADLDGGNFPKDYGDPGPLAKIVKTADTFYSGRWTAPEFGWSDTVPGERIPTILAMIPRIALFEPEEIQFFDSTSFSPVLTADELYEYAQLVAAYNS